MISLVFLTMALGTLQCSDIKKEKKISMQQENGKFQLLRDGKPYFIKGAVGWNFLDELKAAGANSLRSSPSLLNRADSLGLSMLVNLPMGAERNGFDYNDEVAVQQQFDKVKDIIETYKDHPAVLMWSIGNELDHIPGDLDYNLKLWDAINDIARMIKEIDPYGHPVMTVIGYGKLEKIRDIKERCPDLDLLGINAYASLLKVPEWLTQYGWDKPYVVTEWGPSGWWEVPRTNYGVVIEETSSEKAVVYRERYEKVILADPRCLGSYVFLWTSNRQERTHTWFNMFHNDLKTETVEVMQYMWTKEWPQNRAPQIHALRIDGQSAVESITLRQGELALASVDCTDPDGDTLRYEWELLPEPTSFGSYAGQGEVKPEAVSGVFELMEYNQLQFKVPSGKGRNYRLFVYVYDDHGSIGVANIPFYVDSK
ncbi:MAG: hypothetical protein JJU28_24085 [Cyclobacteriaceae bacterium]|nr:hypothetical protein [Cyclobacteriaceae bacterium]